MKYTNGLTAKNPFLEKDIYSIALTAMVVPRGTATIDFNFPLDAWAS